MEKTLIELCEMVSQYLSELDKDVSLTVGSVNTAPVLSEVRAERADGTVLQPREAVVIPAGADGTAVPFPVVRLVAAGMDAETTSSDLTFVWRQVREGSAGQEVLLVGGGLRGEASFVARAAGSYVFEVTATDG